MEKGLITPDDQKRMKLKYEEMIKEVAANKPPKVIMRRKWIEMMINRIICAKSILRKDCKAQLPSIVQEALDKYDVEVTSASHTRLMSNTTELYDTPKEIIALEDSFPLALQAHLQTNHGGCTAMGKWLEDSRLELSSICLSTLISVCPKCILGDDTIPFTPNLNNNTDNFELKQEIKEENIEIEIMDDDSINSFDNHSPELRNDDKPIIIGPAYIDIINMSHLPDKSFSKILLYQDMKSGFIQLRALSNRSVLEEATMELVKLFSDFSPPSSIVVQDIHLYLFQSMIQRLNYVFNTNISMTISSQSDISLNIIKLLTYRLNTNMNICWSMECHLIQWEFNNQKQNSSYLSHFEQFFGP